MAGTHFGMFFVGIKIYSKMCYIHVIKSWRYAGNFILSALELYKYVDTEGGWKLIFVIRALIFFLALFLGKLEDPEINFKNELAG